MEVVIEAERRRRLAAIAVLLAVDAKEKERREKKRLWSRKWLLRRNSGRDVLTMLFEELGPEDPKSFKNYTRMQKDVLEELLHLVTPLIKKKDTVMREAISPRVALAATLRYLATGNTFQDLSYCTRIATNTLSKLVPNTLKAIVTVLEHKIHCPSSPLEWEAVAGQFYALWQYPHCIGALDGKHVNFRPPRKEGSKFRNYKGRDSIVLLGLVDASYKFLFVDIGRNGRMHDASVFRESLISAQLYSGELNLPLPCPLPGCETNIPYVIVADDAFPLKLNVMKPYPGRDLNPEKRIFNYRLSRARRTVENAFGILANRFRILLHVVPLSVEKVELITHACCVLHNFLLEKNARWYVPPEFSSDSVGVNIALQGVTLQGGNRPTAIAAEIRDQFSTYFNTVGAIPWQSTAVEKGDY